MPDLEALAGIGDEATSLLGRYPRIDQPERLPTEIRTSVDNARAIIEEATHARSWNEEKLKEFATKVENAARAFQQAVDPSTGDGGGSGPTRSCAFSCIDEADECIARRCPGGLANETPCTCCIECRLAELACMAACVNNPQ